MFGTALLIIVCAALVVTMIVTLRQNSNLVYEELEAYRRRADIQRTVDDLRKLRRDLSGYAFKYCWHRRHSARAQEVMSYIQGRISIIEPGAE
jgi:hypothetical protein